MNSNPATDDEGGELITVTSSDNTSNLLPVIETEKKKKKVPKKLKDDGGSFLPEINKITAKVDPWVRCVDENHNVYYCHAVTGQSMWLGPCDICTLPSFKWCVQCGKSYCDIDFNKLHKEGSTLSDHTTTTSEPLIREELKPDETYCLKCTTKAAVLTCTDCWDSYCDDCFRSTHNVGHLKQHRAVYYEDAKKGWMCIRSTYKEQVDYYVDGSTGKSTFEKPEELMTELELLYCQNFKVCQHAAEKYVAELEALQFEVESVRYERDSLLAGASNVVATLVADSTTGGHDSKSKHSKGKGKGKVKKVEELADSGSVLENTRQYNLTGGILDGNIASAERIQYRDLLLHPSDRRRGKTRTDFIRSLLG